MENNTTDERPRSVSSKPNNAAGTKMLASIVLVVIIAVAGFMAGVGYQKGHTKTTATTAASRFGALGGFASRRLGGRGSVTAVSDTSITINDARTGGSKTYGITSSTIITDNGTTVAASDIKTGDEVFVTTGSSTSTAATRILVNPTQGGFGGPGGQSTGSPSSSI